MICIPVTAGAHGAALRAIRRSAAFADVLELRMDLIQNGRLAELIGQVRACGAVKVLVTHRLQTGSGRLQQRRCIGSLTEAVGLGADFVDMELPMPRSLREELTGVLDGGQRRSRLIVSHHDFQGTPPPGTLKALYRRCVHAGADIVKIVTWANSPQDNLRVLSLIAHAEREGVGLIGFCMGPRGRVSRMAAPLLGSPLSYAALRRGAESAPGQLTVSEMRAVLAIAGRAA